MQRRLWATMGVVEMGMAWGSELAETGAGNPDRGALTGGQRPALCMRLDLEPGGRRMDDVGWMLEVGGWRRGAFKVGGCQLAMLCPLAFGVSVAAPTPPH